jgi:hypothetical protein
MQLLIPLLLLVWSHKTLSLPEPHPNPSIAEICYNSEGIGAQCEIVDSSQAASGSNDRSGDKDWKDVLLFPDGGVYSGGVVNGVQEGTGREETAAGNRYDGEWEGGIKSGAGKYKWKDGRIYKGT